MENQTNNTDIKILNYDEVSEILNVVTSSAPKQEDLNKAYHLVKQFSKSPQSISILLQHVKNNQKTGARQLAAVILSKKIVKHYITFDDVMRQEVTNLLLNCLATETNYLVSKSISLSITRLIISDFQNAQSKFCDNQELYKSNLKENKLLQFVLSNPEKYSQEQHHLFEINLYNISELVDNCDTDALLFFIEEIKHIVKLALEKGTNKMKDNATRCLGSLVRNFDLNQISEFKSLIPIVFENISTYKEETIAHIYETLCDFSVKSLKFFENSFEGIVVITYGLLNNEMYSIHTKMIMAELIQMVAECKKKIFTANSNELLIKGVELAFKLAFEEVSNVSAIDNEETSLFEIGNRLLGVFSITIKSSIIYPLVIKQVTAILNNEKSDEFKRRAAVSAIGVIAEGCEENYRDDMDHIVELLVSNYHKESTILVKTQIIISFDRLTEYFEDIMADYHEKIVPMLINGLQESNNEKIIECSLIELNYFIRYLEDELEEYQNTVVPILINIIHNFKQFKLRSEALNALCTFINCSSDDNLTNKFDFNSLIKSCSAILANPTTQVEENDLKGSALRCVGEIAIKIKLNASELAPYNQIAIEFIKKKDDYVLVENGFSYLGLVCSIVDIEADLDTLMSIAVECIKDESGVQKPKDKDEYGFDSDSEVEDGNVMAKNQIVNDDFINAKCSTILATTLFLESISKKLKEKLNVNPQDSIVLEYFKTKYLKYIEVLINSFDEIWDSIDDNVNYELITAYRALVVSVYRIDESLGKALWIQTVFYNYEKFVEDTDDKQLVIKICEEIFQVINELGKQTFLNAQNQPTNFLDRILAITVKILNKKLPCQIENEDDEEEEEIDSEEKMVNAACDIYLISSEKLGDEFHNSFTLVSDHMFKYLDTKRSEYERSMMFGIFAEVLRYCKISVKFYAERLLSAIDINLKKISKNNDDIYRHIAFLIGIMFESDPTCEVLLKKQQDLVSILQLVFTKSGKLGKDNAIAALCRMAVGLKLDVNSEFFESLLNTVMSNVPLKHDHQENVVVIDFWLYFAYNTYYKGINNKFSSGNPNANESILTFYKQNFNKFLSVVKFVVVNEKKCDTLPETFEAIKGLFAHFDESFKSIVLEYVNSLKPSEKEVFIKKIS